MYNHLSTSRASLSFSGNDCPQNCSSSSDGGYPSSCCCCCCCSCSCFCSIPTNTVAVNSSRLVVPMNPSPPFYGFRQSTLIQLPLSRRRMMFGPPIGDLGITWSRTYGRLDCVRDDRIRDEGVKCKGNGMGLWGGYYSGMSSDTCYDADELISLLSEGLGGEDFGVSERRKKVGLSKKGKVREGGRFVVMEERVYGRGMEGCLWDELESVRARGCRMERLGKEFVKGDGLRLRKGGSFGSSYYSKMKWKEECVEDGLVGSEKETRKRVGVLVVDKRAEDELGRRRIEKYQSVRRDDIEVGTCAGLDLTRKSKKKTRKGLIEETASGKKSVLKQSRLSEAHVSGSGMGSSMRNRYSYRVGESVSDMNSSFGHSRIDNRVSGTSNSRYKHEAVTGNSGFVDKKSMSHSSKFTGREEHVVSASEVCGTCGRVTSGSQAGSSNEQQSKFTQIQCDSAGFISSNEKQSKQEMSSSLIQKSAEEVNQRLKQEHLLASNRINLRTYENYTERADAAERYEENTGISRRHAKLSEIENMGMRLASTVRKQSDTRIKKQEGTSTLIQASLKEEDENSHQECLVATSQTELMRKNQKRIEIVDTGNSYLQHTSRTQQQQDAQVKRSKENTVLISSQFAKGETYHADIQVTSQNQSRKESEVLSGSSQVHFDETIVNSSSASEERLHSDTQVSQVKGSEENTFFISSQFAKVQKYQTDIQVASQKQSRKESKVLSGSSQVHFDGIIVNSSSASEERLHSDLQLAQVKGSEETTVLISSQLAKGEKYQTDIQFTSQKQSRKESEVLSGSSQAHFDETIMNSSSASKERLHSDSQLAQVKGSEETTVLISSQLAKGEKYQTDIQFTSQKQSRKESEVLSGSSHVHFDETIVNSSSASEQRLHSEKTYLSEKVKEIHEHVKETIKHTELRYEVQMPLREPSTVKKETSGYPYVTSTSQAELRHEVQTPLREPSTVKKDSTSYPYVTSTSQVRIEEIDEEEDQINLPSDPPPRLAKPHVKETIKQTEHRYEVHTPVKEPSIVKETSRYPYVTSTSQVRIEEIGEEEDERNLPSRPSPRLAQPPQSIEVHPVSIESASRFSSQDSRRNSEGESSICIEPLATDASPQVDVLGSAERMESSYHQVIGDFVANIRHQESTSVIEMENNLPKRQLLNEEVVFTCEHSAQSDSESGKLMKECSRCSSGSGTGNDPLATDASPHVDLLGSAERMDNLYHQVIGNFVENIRHEQSTSVIEIEKKLPKWQSQSEGVGCTHEESVHSDSESGKLMKEPAGEILTLQQPPEREASDTDAAPQNGTPRRSGRTLWNVVANIARLRWGVLGESRKSTVKSGGQSSLSDSTGSESLFSGYYPNDAQGGNMDLGTLRTQIEPSSTYQPLLVLNTGDETGLAVDSGLSLSFGGISGDTNIDLNVEMGSQDTASMDWTQSPASQLRRSHRRSDAIYELQEGGIEATGSGTMGQIKGDLDLTVVSSSEENVSELNVDEMSSQATASMDWVQSPASQLRRSHSRSDAIYEQQEGGIEATGSGTVGQIKGDLDPSLTVVSSSEENVLELKGKNLLRSNQVMKERFDEWGEAYRLESEQRKIDQTFMREALEEAKKAAGMWEFPVGAVLVKDGEIIARGHNCVEDLRDSTAHAEILCIREASSIVKTWRLSETALYVTLEPCAMCAGAILQARVGTLVYGAPNKLLGADGSWVRLFPGSSSADAEGGPESTTKPEGPVHPFHPKMIIRRGILETECSDLMQQSFKLRRKTDKKNEQSDEKRSNRKVLHPSKLLHKMHHMFFFC